MIGQIEHILITSAIGAYLGISTALIFISIRAMGPRVLWSAWLWPLTLVEELYSEWRHRDHN